LRNKSLDSKIALDAVPRASNSIGLVWRHDSPPSRRGDCVNAGPFGRSEFARTTSSHGGIASWMRGYTDRFRQLSSHCHCVSGDCAGDCRTIFGGSGARFDLGCGAVSQRAHFWTRAACALL